MQDGDFRARWGERAQLLSSVFPEHARGVLISCSPYRDTYLVFGSRVFPNFMRARFVQGNCSVPGATVGNILLSLPGGG